MLFSVIELLEGMRDVRGVVWVDLDEDVSRFVSIVEYDDWY